MSDFATLDDMSKKPIRTVPIHVRLHESDVAEIDRIADDELMTRSQLVARIVREWIKKRLPPKRR